MASKRKILEHALARLPEDTDIITFVQHEHLIELFVRYPEPKSRDVTCVHCGGSHCVLKDNVAKQIHQTYYYQRSRLSAYIS